MGKLVQECSSKWSEAPTIEPENRSDPKRGGVGSTVHRFRLAGSFAVAGFIMAK
jgi:hypothetical protein